MKILFTGDAYLNEKIDLTDPLKQIINSNDFIVVNLEGVVTNNIDSRDDKASSFKINIENIIYFQEQIETEVVLFLCNNHMLDFGSEGLKDCIANIQNAGFRFVLDELCVNYGDESLILNGFTSNEPSVMSVLSSNTHQFLDYYDDVKFDNKFQRIAICHWGDEYVSVPHHRIMQRAIRLADSFDLIIGHHPHVIQGSKKIASSEVFFSLGNFYLKNFIYKNGSVHIFPNECSYGILVQFDTNTKKSEVFGCMYDQNCQRISLSNFALNLYKKRSSLLEKDVKETHILWETSYYDYLKFKRNLFVNIRSVWPKYKGILWNYLKKILGS